MTDTTINCLFPIYVISLSEAIQRRNHIIKQFQQKNIVFRFYEAVDKNNYQDYLKVHHLQVTNNKLSDGEIACFLSHYSLWQTLIKSEPPYLVIFEDDVHLSSDTDQVFANVDWLPPKFELIKLETMQERVLIDSGKAITANHSICRMLSRHMGGAGYIISRAGAKQLIDYVEQKGINVPVDHVLFDIFIDPYHFWYQISPAICIQEQFIFSTSQLTSDLETTRGFKKNPKARLTAWQKVKREIGRLVSQLTYSYLHYQWYLKTHKFKKTKIAFAK